VFITHSAALSGAELALVRLLAYTPELDPYVIVGEDGPLVPLLREGGATVSVVRLGPRAAGVTRVASRRSAARAGVLLQVVLWTYWLVREIRAIRPDLVETGSMKAHFCGGLAARLLGIPLVWRAHDRLAEPYLGFWAARVSRLAVRMLPSFVVANSRSTAETLPVSSERLAVISVPVPESPASLVRRRGPVTVGHVGRISPWKGQDVFLQGFASAFRAGQERAVIVGAPLFGEDAYFQSLLSLVDELGIKDRVLFAGHQSDVARSLATFDILVHSSTVPEPFGQVVVEGMSMGLPVIASATGGPAEVIDPGRTGLLVPPADPDALAKALKLLADDPGLRHRLGEAGRAASCRYSPSEVVPSLLAIYSRVSRRMPISPDLLPPAESGDVESWDVSWRDV
jgi:glycosyltransferase involved in cell wall biosynthesis